MSKKTNKTSHVMDLLTNGASPETEAPAAEPPSGQEKKPADIQSHTVTPSKVTVVDEGSRNDRLSQEILGKLTEELEEETRQEMEARDADRQEVTAPEADDQEQEMTAADVQEPEVLAQETGSLNPESQGAELPAPETAEPAAVEDPQTALQAEETAQASAGKTQEPAAASQAPESKTTGSAGQETPNAALDANAQNASPRQPGSGGKSSQKEPHPIIPGSQFDDRFQDKEYRFLNVMEQLLMRQNLESVLTQYEVCTCPRCMSDVCALALTGLPAKYVVTSKDSISPLISYYENKYKIPVLTELMKACNKVRQNPRHKVSKASS